MRLSRIAAVIEKEGKDILRDPITVAVALLMPLIMPFLFGYAISLDIDNVPLGVLDEDHSAASRALVDRFVESSYFRLAALYDSDRQVEGGLQRGRVDLVLVIPPRFEERMAAREAAPVQVLVDGSYSATANLVAGYAATIISRFGRAALSQPVRAEIRVWYNPDQSFTSFSVLSMVAIAALMVGVFHPAASIVREKEAGTIEQLQVTPIGTAELFGVPSPNPRNF